MQFSRKSFIILDLHLPVTHRRVYANRRNKSEIKNLFYIYTLNFYAQYIIFYKSRINKLLILIQFPWDLNLSHTYSDFRANTLVYIYKRNPINGDIFLFLRGYNQPFVPSTRS